MWYRSWGQVNLVLTVKGSSGIAGDIVGDCVSIDIRGDGAVTISGTINNVCATLAIAGVDAPAIEIEAPGGVSLDDATIVSSGPVTVVSETSSPAPSRSPAAQASTSATPGVISLESTSLRADPTEVPQPQSADDRPDGASNTFCATSEIIINGVTIRA